MSGFVLGIDIGGTKTRVGIVDRDLRVLDTSEAPTPAFDGAGAVLERTVELARGLIGRHGQVEAVGVGCAGVVDSGEGRVVSAAGTFAGWAGTPVAEVLSAELGIPVRADNDVNAFTLGEFAAGAARGARSALGVTIGTGVGGGLVIEGRPWRGAHHVAGEVGHLPLSGFEDRPCSCGQSGHFEAVAAGPGILRRLAEVGNPVDDLRDRDRLGDGAEPVTRAVVVEAAEVTGRTLAGLVNVIDPEVVVVGGGVSGLGPLWSKPVEESFRTHLHPHVADIPLLPAGLGADAVLVGGAALVSGTALEAR